MKLEEKVLNTFYRNQRKNTWWNNIVRKTITCFYTSMCIFLSNWKGEATVKNDFVKEYMDETEAKVGKKGLAEQVMKYMPWISGRTGAWWDVHRYAAEHYLKPYNKKVYFKNISFDRIYEIIKEYSTPVVVGTKLTHGGHIVCFVGYKIVEGIRYWKLMDPWGEWNTKYINFTDGDGFWVMEKEIMPFMGNKKGGDIRSIYAI